MKEEISDVFQYSDLLTRDDSGTISNEEFTAKRNKFSRNNVKPHFFTLSKMLHLVGTYYCAGSFNAELKKISRLNCYRNINYDLLPCLIMSRVKKKNAVEV